MPIGADVTPQYTEEAVGGGHPTKARVVSRDFIVEHHVDGRHKADKLPILANCRLVRTNATTLTLQRLDGKSVPFIDAGGNLYFLQLASEPTLANTGLTASALYYIYAYDNAGAAALEASTTAYAAHASGLRTKSGDNTRTLVGMIRTEGSTPGNFVDSVTQRFTRSWFNRRRLPLFNAFTADRTTASATFVELNTEIRVEFASWAGEMVAASAIANAHHPTAGNRTEAIIAVDAATAAFGAGGRMTAPANAYVVPLPAHGRDNALSEGYHYLTLSGRSVDGGTATFLGTTTPERCSLSAEIGGAA